MSRLVSFFVFFFCTSCFFEKGNSTFYVYIPSITFDMRMSSSLTYSAFSILSETSGYLGRLDKDLVIEPRVLKSYKIKDNIITLQLDEKYRSFRGEFVDAEDVIFSIKYFLKKHPSLSFVLKEIDGAKECIEIKKCDNISLKRIDKFKVQITLQKENKGFVEKLMNPWFILYKAGKPLYETVGDCKIPYQTGISKLLNCKKNHFLELEIKSRLIRVTNRKEIIPLDAEKAYLVQDNPTSKISPSLTVMTIFANPNQKIPAEDRRDFMMYIKEQSSAISAKLNLKHAPMMISSWLDMEVKNMNYKREKVTKCDKGEIRVLLDTSLPNHKVIKEHLANYEKCRVSFEVTSADTYFDRFKDVDYGIAWFTPDEIDYYNFYSSLDCNPGGNCYFNWRDDTLNKMLLNLIGKERDSAFTEVLAIEKFLLENGYAASMSELNWWIISGEGLARVIHPSGLAQIQISDFLI